MTSAEKVAALEELGHKRQQAAYPGYSNVGDFHGGAYETDWVSPYTKSAANVDSWLVLVLQDWSSADSLAGRFDPDSADLGYTRTATTNKRLTDLLRATYGLEFKDVFVTNLFPFIKSGGMSRGIPQRDLDGAFRDFCWPQIRIVSPKLVICLGKAVYDTFAKNLGGPSSTSREAGTFFRSSECAIYHQFHPALRGIDPYGRMLREWRHMQAVAQV